MIKRREFRLEKGKNVKDTKGNVKITSHKEETRMVVSVRVACPPRTPHPPPTHTQMTLIERRHYKELQASSSSPTKKRILCLGTFFEYMSGNANMPQLLVSFEK